jgi:hypothetical protein
MDGLNILLNKQRQTFVPNRLKQDGLRSLISVDMIDPFDLRQKQEKQ